MYASLPGARLTNVTLLGEMWSVPCTTEVNVSLSFGGVRYPVHPLDISAPLALLTGDPSQEGCVGLWRSIDKAPTNLLVNALDMIFGAAFRESSIFGGVFRHLTDRSEKRIHSYQLRNLARAVLQQRQRAICAAAIDYERHCARARRVRGGALDSGGDVGNFTSSVGYAWRSRLLYPDCLCYPHYLQSFQRCGTDWAGCAQNGCGCNHAGGCMCDLGTLYVEQQVRHGEQYDIRQLLSRYTCARVACQDHQTLSTVNSTTTISPAQG
jgi:hypothetical protein